MGSKQAETADETPTFASARERLDEILEELESGGGDVDKLAARIKEAATLLRFCRERLSAARHEVQQVVAELREEDAALDAPAAPETSATAGGEDEKGDLPF